MSRLSSLAPWKETFLEWLGYFLYSKTGVRRVFFFNEGNNSALLLAELALAEMLIAAFTKIMLELIIHSSVEC